MRAVQWSVVFALLASLVGAGCIGEGGGSAVVPDGIPAGEAPTGANAGDSASHGQPQRADSAVTVTRDGSQYVAQQVVTVTNDFGGAALADVALETVNGGVTAKSWTQGGYESKVTLQGRAPTEQQARDALAKMTVVHDDRLASDRLTLSTEVRFPSSFGSNVNGQASIVLSVPPQPSYRLTLDSVNGGVGSAGLGGSSVSAHTTNGGVDVSGAFNSLTAGTTSGSIDLEGRANSVRAVTDNGAIDVRLEPTASGSYALETINGAIEATLVGPGAFDVEAGAVNGAVSVDLDGGEDVGSQSRTHKHVRSAGYDAAPIRLEVSAETVNGSIDVEG